MSLTLFDPLRRLAYGYPYRFLAGLAVVGLALYLTFWPQPLEERDKLGRTPLIRAAEQGELGAVERLLARGARVDARDNCRWTAMMKAAAKGHAQVVELLLAHGAEVNAVDKGGYSALMVAAADGHAASVHLLLDHGADPDLQDGSLGWTALIWAAKEGQLETVELLLAGGASPQIVDNAGQSARRWAERAGHRAVAARLHAAGG